MENVRASSSHRGGSFPWRNNSNEVFSRSIRDVDDEEALKWAALEKLPTYNRLTKGLLTTSKGESSEVDIDKLGFHEKKGLIQRLVRVAEDDNEKFLMKLRNRIDRVGIELPTIEVRFEHLNVEGEAHIGSRALPSFINFFADIAESFTNFLHVLPSKKRRVSILNDVSGIITPSRIALLLGPPSSGKTTLLLALAGELDPTLKTSGTITYNGQKMNEFVPQRTAAYISQQDVHTGELTVRETLAFAARIHGVGDRYEMLAELARREKIANIKPDPDIDVFMKAITREGQESSIITEYVLKILGLDICADTLVGNQVIRGVSGGQRKRVTTGEMLVGPSKALFMDEISTGLDSSTTFQIVNSIKQYIRIMNGTAVISLLQPPPETYNLFDDIILLTEGQIVYQGPRQHVLEFFEHMGFKCPERKSVADFLQEVTSRKDQQQYWMNQTEPYSFVTAKEFAEEFKSFHVGRKFEEDLSIPFDKSKSHPAALTTKKYGVRKWELFKACFSKELLLMKRNSFLYYFKLVQLSVMTIIAMTVFLRTKMHRDSVSDGGIYAGSLFCAVTVIMFHGMADVPMTVESLPVFYKQRNLLFYPAWAFSLPSWILRVPVTLVEVAVWVFVTYYVIGYDPNVGRLFRQYLLLVLVSQMGSGLFRFVASIGRSMIIANTLGVIALLLVFVLGGFVLSHDKIKKWWIWGYWVSPMMYGQNAILVNEFLGKSWNQVLPGSTEPLGIEVLKSRGFFTDSNWYWIGVGGLVGFTLLLNLGATLALTYLSPFRKPQTVAEDESTSREANGAVQLTDRSNSSHQQQIRGMILPFEPHSVTFHEIKYSVDMPQEMRSENVTQDKLELLKGVSGSFRPQVLTALMGVSGAGKTTLMDVLAGRKTGGYIEGNITVSGHPKSQETFARISGYCEQNDIHSPNVTVYESLLYSAWLRLPSEVNSETRKMFVDEVMELVELTPLRQALVGLPGVSGLSTEQRKRLTIAVELVANPSIIFMDEPTSGLDARAAAIVMRTVRNTVDTGRTVVCTIHQPSIDIFEAFDELFLMKRGGQEIYVGPLGHRSCHLINYFEGINGVDKIEKGFNPATWMLEVTTSAQEAALGIDFAAIYKNSDLFKRNISLIEELSKPAPDSKDLYFPTKYSQSFLSQCLACLWKQQKSYWRNPQYTAIRFLFTTAIALVFGSIFWDLGFNKNITRKDLFNAMGSMYAATIFIGFTYASSVQPVVDIERTVFYREKSAGMYSPLPYAYAQVLVELPYIFVQSAIYSAIVYAMIGFQWTAAKFFWYLFFTFSSLLYFTCFGMMSIAFTPNQNMASIISSAFYAIWNLFAGFIIPRPRIPGWWRWYYWVDPISWTLYGLVVSQYGDVQKTIETNQTVESFLKDYFGFRHDFLGVVAAVNIGFAAVFAVLFAFGIKFLNFQRR